MPDTITTPSGIVLRQVINHHPDANKAVYRDDSGRWQVVPQRYHVAVVDWSDVAAPITTFPNLIQAIQAIA